MQTARLEKQLTQKDVAARINEKPSILQDYESGKAIPNPQILGKLERVLGVKLRGAYYLRLPPTSFLMYRQQVPTLDRSWRGRRRLKPLYGPSLYS